MNDLSIMVPRLGTSLFGVVLLAVLLANLIAIVFIALYAHKKKGHSYWLFLLLGLFSNCVVQGILVLVLPNKQVTAPKLPA
jgi:hypothetical protein